MLQFSKFFLSSFVLRKEFRAITTEASGKGEELKRESRSAITSTIINNKKKRKSGFFSGAILKLWKYYFFSTIRRNFSFIFSMLSLSFFLAFFTPLLQSVIRKGSRQFASVKKDDTGIEETQVSLDSILGDITFVEYNSGFYCSDKKQGILNTSQLLNGMLDRKKGLIKEDEAIKEKISKLDKKDNDIKNKEAERRFLITKINDVDGAIQATAFSLAPCSYFYSIFIPSGGISLEKDKKEVFVAYLDTMFWYFGTGIILILIKFLTDKLFRFSGQNNEDAFVLLATPGATRTDVSLAKFLTLISFISLIGLVGFVFQFVICCIIFGFSTSVINIISLVFFMLFLAPIFFTIFFASYVLLVSSNNSVCKIFVPLALPLLIFVTISGSVVQSTNSLFFYDLSSWFSSPSLTLIFSIIGLVSFFFFERNYQKKDIK